MFLKYINEYAENKFYRRVRKERREKLNNEFKNSYQNLSKVPKPYTNFQ